MTTPFAPTGPTVSITAGTSTGNVEVDGGDAWGGDVRVVNKGTVYAYMAFGGSGVEATVAGSVPLVPGAAEVFSMYGGTHAAVIVESGTAVVSFTPGAGI